ncbi:MAG: DUF418 domain-containing protein [Yaniella sp.]|nr:DUF418 domain-containing protein [Yaniella sp.]
MTSTRNQNPHMTQAPVSTPKDRSDGKSRRLHGLDAARALAIVGMLAVNVGPRKEDGETGLAVLIYDLPHGRASLLFMILAGIGMSLMTKRSRQTSAPLPWHTIVWRAALLIFSGLALQMLDHDISVILTYYGVLFLCGLPLLRAPTWLVTALAMVSLVAGPVVWLYMQQKTSTTFDFSAPSFTDPLWTIVHATLLTGAYPVAVWLALFLLGIVLGRLALSERAVQHRLIGWGAVATTVPMITWLLLVVANGFPTSEYGWDQLMSAEPHSQMPLWMISGCGSAVLVIGMFLRGEQVVVHRLSWLVSAGRLALTIYVAHLFILAWLVRPGPNNLVEGYVTIAIMSVFFIASAHLWWRHLGIGPLERLLRWPPRLTR